MRSRCLSLLLTSLVFAFFHSCTKQSQQVTELKHFPLDTMEGVISRPGVEIDKDNSSDGHGSLRITATDSTVVRLFELHDIDIEDARLMYQARVRTEDVTGLAYLMMLCYFKGVGEFFSKGLQTPLKGINEWTTVQTSFSFRKGENPDTVKLQLVIAGSGTVWIDDIRLIKGPPRWEQ